VPLGAFPPREYTRRVAGLPTHPDELIINEMITNQKLARRYRSGYWAGKLINAVGIITIITGLILALLVGVLTITATEIMNRHRHSLEQVRDNLQISIGGQYQIVVGIGIALALLIFLLLWLLGTFVSAAAQIVKAQIDTAVNTSPFLSIEEKQKVIR
jgi:uncharacterized membrane protein YhaH (DUF805 family)